MSDLIRLNPIRWPYSLAQLRIDEPTRSFSPAPSDREYAELDCYRKQPQPQPEFDPATHRVVEVHPALVGGQWLQQWEIVELTAEEAEAHYRATHPPRWIEFNAALPAEVDQLLAAAHTASPRLELNLGVGLGKAADGDSRIFLGAWQAALSLGLVPEQLQQAIHSLAVAHDLPAEFVAGLAGSEEVQP
jgi:hypothetical protein